MPSENIHDWSTTAATNANADSGISIPEGMARAGVNDAMRSMMAAVAKQRNLLNGSITTTGSANAQAFSSGFSYTGSVPTNFRALLKIGASLTNTGSTTLNMDGIGAVTIKSQAGLDLVAGALRAGSYYEFRYDGTNWIMLANFAMPIPTNLRTFTSVGGNTYPTASDGTVKVLCYLKAAGGAGGGASSGTTVAGGGGGEGEEAWALFTAAQLSGQIVTIGSGGLAIAANTNTAGGSGGNSSIFGLLQCNGGAGGFTGNSGGRGGRGGASGASAVTTLAMPGDAGQAGDTVGGGVGGGKGAGIFSSVTAASSGGGGGAGGTVAASSGAGGSGFAVFLEFGTVA